jgi:hypothetical protein
MRAVYRLVTLAAAFLFLLGATAPSAGAATSIGWDEPGVPTILDLPCPGHALTQGTSNDKSYSAPPGSGAISSFRVYGASAGLVQLLVLRTLSLGKFSVVSESEIASVVPGHWNSFETRVPVVGGDVIGLSPRSNGVPCLIETADPADAIDSVFEIAPFAVGSTVTVTGPSVPGFAVNLGATVEPDPDNDGWGNETQDDCPLDPGPNHGCPLPPAPPAPAAAVTLPVPRGSLKVKLSLGPQHIIRQQALRVAISANEAATFVAHARLKALGLKRSWNLRPRRGKLNAGQRQSVELALAPRAVAGLSRAIENGARLRAQVTIEVTGSAGESATIDQSVAIGP